MSDETITQTMALSELMSKWRPGSHDWTWEREYMQLWEDARMCDRTRAVADSIEAIGILRPILLGNDGRVWDGHHRVVIAKRLGIEFVPVEIATGLRFGAPCDVHDVCVDEPGCVLYPEGAS